MGGYENNFRDPAFSCSLRATGEVEALLKAERKAAEWRAELDVRGTRPGSVS